MWSHIKPYMQAASDDPTRFAGVQELGVDTHVWHQDQRRRGPRELTGIVDLTHGRSGTVYKNWLAERGKKSRSNIQIAFLERFQGQQERIDGKLQEATPPTTDSEYSSSPRA